MKTITTPQGKIMEDEIEKLAREEFEIPETEIGNVYFGANIAFLRVGFKKGFKAARVYSEADLTRFNSDTFIENVCLSFRHDYGLMAEQDRQRLRFDCKEWMRAITNNWEYFKS